MEHDLESRVKAIEDQLIPDPDKISTMKASNRVKRVLDNKKIGKESQQDVIMRIVDRNEFLEARVEFLEARDESLEVENQKLKNELELCHLECEGLKCGITGKELKTAYDEAK